MDAICNMICLKIRTKYHMGSLQFDEECKKLQTKWWLKSIPCKGYHVSLTARQLPANHHFLKVCMTRVLLQSHPHGGYLIPDSLAKVFSLMQQLSYRTEHQILCKMRMDKLQKRKCAHSLYRRVQSLWRALKQVRTLLDCLSINLTSSYILYLLYSSNSGCCMLSFVFIFIN